MSRCKPYRVPPDVMRRVEKYLEQFEFTKDQYFKSYQQWSRGGFGWGNCQTGGTYQMRILMWYHHIHKPNSKEWRPRIILTAVVNVMKENELCKDCGTKLIPGEEGTNQCSDCFEESIELPINEVSCDD